MTFTETPPPLTGTEATPPPVDPVVITEGTGLRGIRRAVTNLRLGWVRESLADLEDRDTVYRAAPDEARRVNSFRSEAPDSETQPITAGQNLNAARNQRIVKKKHRVHGQAGSLEEAHGTPVDPNEGLPPLESIENPYARRFEAARRKRAAKFEPLQHDLDKPTGSLAKDVFGGQARHGDRQPIKHRAAVHRAGTKYRGLEEKIHEKEKKLDRASEGKTWHGEYRTRRIEQKAEQVERLRRILDGTELSYPERAARGTVSAGTVAVGGLKAGAVGVGHGFRGVYRGAVKAKRANVLWQGERARNRIDKLNDRRRFDHLLGKAATSFLLKEVGPDTVRPRPKTLRERVATRRASSAVNGLVGARKKRDEEPTIKNRLGAARQAFRTNMVVERANGRIKESVRQGRIKDAQRISARASREQARRDRAAGTR